MCNCRQLKYDQVIGYEVERRKVLKDSPLAEEKAEITQKVPFLYSSSIHHPRHISLSTFLWVVDSYIKIRNKLINK